MANAAIIGLISDTHGLMREEALAAPQGTDLIIHAGDVGKPRIIEQLRALAPVVGVRGNIDKGHWASQLPETAVVEAGPALIYVIHDIAQLDLDPAAGFNMVVSGHSHKPGQTGDVRYVTPEYFEALNIAIRSGRVFTDQDRSKTGLVVVIDDTVVRRYLPDENPVGKRLIPAGMTYTIIGVVGHVMHDDLSDAGRGAIYFGMFQQGIPQGAVVVKTTGDAATLAPAIRATIREVDAQQAVFAVRPMDELVAKSLAPRRFAVRLLGFGVISYSVAQRTREIGIRVALGAERRTVIGQVVGQGLKMAGIGVGIGITGAVLCGRLLSTELFGVTSFDPLTLLAMAAALMGSAAIASYLPALRAAGVDPIAALRVE